MLGGVASAQKAPPIEDLPRLQHDLRGALQNLDAAQFTYFAQTAFFEAGTAQITSTLVRVGSGPTPGVLQVNLSIANREGNLLNVG